MIRGITLREMQREMQRTWRACSQLIRIKCILSQIIQITCTGALPGILLGSGFKICHIALGSWENRRHHSRWHLMWPDVAINWSCAVTSCTRFGAGNFWSIRFWSIFFLFWWCEDSMKAARQNQVSHQWASHPCLGETYSTPQAVFQSEVCVCGGQSWVGVVFIDSSPAASIYHKSPE